MRMTTRPGVATHNGGVREACTKCGGFVAVFGPKDAKMHAEVRICPVCDKRPELAQLWSRLPTQTFLTHAATCSTCKQFPAVMCATGRARLADVPGFWSEAGSSK